MSRQRVIAGLGGRFDDTAFFVVKRIIQINICCHAIHIGWHSFPRKAFARGLFMRGSKYLLVAQAGANHESARTTGLYDRRNDQVSLDEVERILI